MNQLDQFHISQSITRLCGVHNTELASALRRAINRKDRDFFLLLTDTYESRLEEAKERGRVDQFRNYILNNWERIFDWRKAVPKVPALARGLGAMESRQRTVTFRMKHRGMHWSAEGAEAMVKIMQGLLNDTLREAYTRSLKVSRSAREQRKAKRTFRLAQILKDPVRPSDGTRKGTITLDSSHSSATGRLVRNFSSPY